MLPLNTHDPFSDYYLEVREARCAPLLPLQAPCCAMSWLSVPISPWSRSPASAPARVASALTRWVVATANLVILRRRERQLTAVAREIFRCRANVPPVRVLI